MSDNVEKHWQDALMQKDRTWIEITAPVDIESKATGKLHIYPTIFACYDSRFRGILNFVNRQLNAAGLRKLLETTKDQYGRVLTSARRRKISEDKVFKLVIEWVEKGLYADTKAVEKVFPFDIVAIKHALGLQTIPSSDALRKDLGWDIQNTLLVAMQKLSEKEFFTFLEANLGEELAAADITKAEQLEISAERREELLETDEFWAELQKNTINNDLRRYTWLYWVSNITMIRNAATHRDTASLTDLIRFVDCLTNAIASLNGQPKSIQKLRSVRRQLVVWKSWSDNDKAECLKELIEIFELIRKLFKDDDQFRAECEIWEKAIMQKRKSDREALWPSFYKNIKDILNDICETEDGFEAPTTRERLSTTSLVAKCDSPTGTTANEQEPEEDEIEEVAEKTSTRGTKRPRDDAGEDTLIGPKRLCSFSAFYIMKVLGVRPAVQTSI